MTHPVPFGSLNLNNTRRIELAFHKGAPAIGFGSGKEWGMLTLSLSHCHSLLWATRDRAKRRGESIQPSGRWWLNTRGIYSQAIPCSPHRDEIARQTRRAAYHPIQGVTIPQFVGGHGPKQRVSKRAFERASNHPSGAIGTGGSNELGKG